MVQRQPTRQRSGSRRANPSAEKRSDGGIAGIMFCEFDVLRGPVLQHQCPENLVSKETFEALSVYLIPKPELYGKLITINAFELKILGYPVCIRDAAKYKRNQLIFNLCFVFDKYTSSTQYEPIIQKLAHYLVDLEAEMEFISEKREPPRFPRYLATVRQQLNQQGVCTIRVSMATTLHLKLSKVQPNPRLVEEHHVPVVLEPDHFGPGSIAAWDLTTQQLYYYIDGVNHVAKIAFLADVDVNLVKACLQNLIYYGLVTLVPIFLYSNVYVTTPLVRRLMEDQQLQRECLRAVRKPSVQPGAPEPSLKRVLNIYSHMCPGMTVRDLCHRFGLHSSGIDEQRLVRFGLLKGLIRRMQKYPVLVPEPGEPCSPLYGAWFDGKRSYDQLCCELNKTHADIEEKVERNGAVVVCWK